MKDNTGPKLRVSAILVTAVAYTLIMAILAVPQRSIAQQNAMPTVTPIPSDEEAQAQSTITTVPLPTRQKFPFTIGAGSPAYTANLDIQVACAFQGIAGQVFDLKKEPLQGLIIAVTATNGFNQMALSGTGPPQFGVSGFMIQVGSAPAA